MTNNNDKFWMEKALHLAQVAFDAGEVPVGAVVVIDGGIIGEGWNRPISDHDPSAHAEIVALREAAKNIQNYRLPDATLYVTIEPCTMCVGAIIHSRVKRVVFGAKEPKAGVLASHQHLLSGDIYNHEFEWQGGICEEQCSELMQLFFRQRREQKKALKRASENSE